MDEWRIFFQPHAAWVGGLIGLVLGSFVNVVIHRMPLIMAQQWQQDAPDRPSVPGPFNLAIPRSHCPDCKHGLAWWGNLPVLSFVLLKGRCHVCHARIGWRYPAIEVVTALALAACFQHWGLSWQACAWAGFICTVLALAVIDWDTTYLPDQMTQPLTWAGLMAAALGWSNVVLVDALWGAVAGYLFLWAVYWLFKLCTGKEGMGYGDFKFFAALGAWFGWAALIPLILWASLAGIAAGLVLQQRQQLRDNHCIPFGPFLAMAAAAYMVWGNSLTRLGWA